MERREKAGAITVYAALGLERKTSTSAFTPGVKIQGLSPWV
jgi:hypothetical protein